MSKVLFITGVSSGLGKALLTEAAQAGHTVVGTVRKTEQVAQIGDVKPGSTFGYAMDVNDHERVQEITDQVVARFGRIDVVINNAGYGLMGAIEETSMEEARHQMETNFFGALAVTQAAIPHLRRQGSGHIVQVSSVAGLLGTPGLGLYNASKFALEGMTEALRAELAPFNISVTIVEPGPFRTAWAGSSMQFAKKNLPGYEATAHQTRKTITGYSGNQPGDPAKGAQMILKLLEEENPPLRLVLGRQALERARNKPKQLTADFDQYETWSTSTDFE